MSESWITPKFILVVCVVCVIGFTAGYIMPKLINESATSYDSFVETCERTGGEIYPGPPCGEECTKQWTQCICPDGTQIIYKNVSDSYWVGCPVI